MAASAGDDDGLGISQCGEEAKSGERVRSLRHSG